MKIIFLILLFISSLSSVLGQTKSYFPNLTRVCIDKVSNIYFNYDNSNTRFINKLCYELDKNDTRHCIKDSVFFEWKIIAKFKNDKLKDSVYIIYSPGMSEDPSFGIYTEKDKILGKINCLEFYINSNGIIYTSGHTNNMYNRKRKFQIQNDTIKEINQPFNYVGLKGKTLNEITLYSDTSKTEIVAKLPKGYFIEILLTNSNTKDFDIDYMYLVRTEFGLVGWLKLEGFAEPIIDGLFYAGD